MSPFSHFLYDLRVRHQIRQVDLAQRIGYEQSYISALEAGLKGPPTQEFVDRLKTELKLSDDDAHALQVAADASQRRLVIELDMPQDVYWLINRLREKLPALTPTQVRVINDVLSMATAPADGWSDTRRRLPRRRKEAPQVGNGTNLAACPVAPSTLRYPASHHQYRDRSGQRQDRTHAQTRIRQVISPGAGIPTPEIRHLHLLRQ